jgi:hypothetical protein
MEESVEDIGSGLLAASDTFSSDSEADGGCDCRLGWASTMAG